MTTGTRIVVEQGDITEFAGDAIVNAANNHLVLGAGVAGAIARKGGPEIQRECNAHGPIQVGEAAITGAGNLAVRHVIHAAAMGDRPASRASIAGSTRHALQLADSHAVRTIAFPILASGVAGYPIDEAARIMVETMREYIASGQTRIDQISLYGFSTADAEAVRGVVETS